MADATPHRELPARATPSEAYSPFEAERILLETLPLVEAAAEGTVLGSASVRHDRAEAVEESVLDEPVDEVILALSPAMRITWWHRDLHHRLHRFGIPVALLP
ncbi:hypothetical protein [Pedococcus sp. 2YAF34]|uniref:hypothetical protein n=1 Tax=Pedococcus sp. 2YAF34 TaxID=3233032 RepID=UPI003F9561C2